MPFGSRLLGVATEGAGTDLPGDIWVQDGRGTRVRWAARDFEPLPLRTSACRRGLPPESDHRPRARLPHALRV